MTTLIRFLIRGWTLMLILFTYEATAQCGMTVDIIADPPPPYNLCPGEDLVLTANITGGVSPYEYEWYGAWPGVLTTQSITLPLPYQGGIQLFVTDANGCMANGFIHIKAWVMTVEIVFNPELVCQGDSVLLYSWPDFPNGTTFLWSTGETTQNIYVYGPGTYSVTATNPNGCSDSDSQEIFFNTEPTPVPIISGPSSLCEGASATLTVDGGPFAWYYWNTFETDPTLDITGPGLYWVEVANAIGCISGDTLIIESGTTPPVLEGPSGICAGQPGIITVTNASDYEEFDWSTGSNNSSITVINPGTYTVTVTDEGGCSAIASFTVASNNPNINLSGTTTAVTSCITANGAINLSVSPADAYTFNWSNGATTEDINNLSEGNYSVTVTDAGGCTATTSFTVTLNATTPFILSFVTDATCGQDNGAIDLNVTPPAGSYTYIWSNGMTSQDLSNVTAGTYNVTVTGSNGCTSTSTITINDDPIIFTVTGVVTQPTDGQSNGAIDISVSPIGSFTYVWSNGATTQDISALAPGTYTVTVTSGTCTQTASFTLIDALPCDGFSAFVADPIGNVFCIGDELTLITFIIGGTAPFTYLWSTGGTGSTETIIITGNIDVTLTVTDANGCTSTSGQHIKPLLWWAVANIIGDSACIGEIITIETSFNPWTIHLWSTGETTSSIQVTTPGTYTVTITDDPTGCTNVLEVTPTFLSGLDVEITGPVSVCPGQVAELSTLGGPFDNYLWSPGGQTTPTIAVSNPGTYGVTVSNGTACDGFTEFTIISDEAEPPMLVGTSVLCNGQSGLIEITNSGSYVNVLWNTGETTSSISVNQPNTYSVTVTSAEGCTAQGSFIVSANPNAPTLSANILPSTCLESNGSIDLIVSPQGTYTYMWSNGITTEDLFSIQSDVYNVTVTSVDGCTALGSFEVPDDEMIITISGTTTHNTSCAIANGSIDITVDPGADYTYAWSNGASTQDLSDLSEGVYTVTVSFGIGCDETASYEIDDNLSVPTLTGVITQNTSCDQPNGAINLSIAPAGSYNIIWSNGESSEDLDQLSGGSYGVTITSNDGCTISEVFEIINTSSVFSLEGNVTHNQSCASQSGAIDLSVSPAAVYTYLWSNGAVTEDLQALSEGEYGVTVMDTNNCSVIGSFVVEDSVSYPEISAQVSPSSCGANNGNIDLNVLPIDGYTYLWSNGSNTEDISDLPPGVYLVTVSGANGCTTSDTFLINDQSTDVSISGVSIANNSCIDANGAIDLVLTTSGIYTVLWSTGDTSVDLQNLSSGIYQVTVTDHFGCTVTSVFTINDNTSTPTIATSITSANCGGSNGAIDLSIAPAGDYTFLWSNGSTTEDLLNVLTGSYSVIVTDINGCQAFDTFNIENINNNFSLSAIQVSLTSCTAPNGSIDLTMQPSGVYTFLWSNGETAEDRVNLTSGSYSVTVTDINGCSSASTFVVEDEREMPVISETIMPSVCGNQNGQIDLIISPSGVYSYDWSNGSVQEDLSALASGTYSVTVTSQYGCSATATFSVPNTSTHFSFSAITSNNTSCTDFNGAIDLTMLPSGNYNYVWSNGATSEDLVNLAAGIYTVTVTDLSSCSSASVYTLESDIVDLLVEEVISPAFCGKPNGAIDLNVTPATGNSFNWSNGSVTEDLEDILPGSYRVTITGGNGCTWSSTFEIPGSDQMQIAIEADAVTNGDEEVTINAHINLPLNALDTLIWLPSELFSCTQGLCLQQTIPMPSERTEITVMAFDTNGCMAQASLMLEASIDPNVYIPNVFSPNGDGVNDMFTVFGNEDVELVVEMQIFDRWGNFVFANTMFPLNEENYGWDGHFKEILMNPAVFVYWAKVRYIDGTEDFYKGDVTLVR